MKSVRRFLDRFNGRRCWTVRYPDGGYRELCDYGMARDYQWMFGGEIIWRGDYLEG